MRKFILAGALLLSVHGMADGEDRTGTIREYRFGACDYWQSLSADMGRMYACGFRPQTITVPESRDVAREFNDANRRIQELEARVAKLEAALAEATR